MSDKDMIKKAYNEAENSLKEKKIEEIKKIVLATLEKIQLVDKELEQAKEKVKDIEEKRKILRMDIDDLKEGRLDRIEERQAKDKKAKDISVVIVIKEKETIKENDKWLPWYQPYKVTWNTSVASDWIAPIAYTTCNNATLQYDGLAMKLTGYECKPYVIGTYSVNNATIHLR